MGWITLAVTLLKLATKIWDAINDHNIERKKQKTEALQSGIRAIVDRDASRLNSAIGDLNRMR